MYIFIYWEGFSLRQHSEEYCTSSADIDKGTSVISSDNIQEEMKPYFLITVSSVQALLYRY